MTCIVAIKKDGRVHMGADSAGSDEESGIIFPYIIPKVFERNGYLIGYAGSFKIGKVLQYIVNFPDIPPKMNTHEKLDEFLNGIVMPNIGKQVKELEIDKEDMDFDLILAINGHIFEISNSWDALEASLDFLAIGSGTKYALGSLYTTQTWKDPIRRINVALQAASEYSMSVAPPFNIIST